MQALITNGVTNKGFAEAAAKFARAAAASGAPAGGMAMMGATPSPARVLMMEGKKHAGLDFVCVGARACV